MRVIDALVHLLSVVLAHDLSVLTPDLSPDEVARRLDKLAEGRDLNWRGSVVDLLALVHLDSSMAARGRLARELGYVGAAAFVGSAEQNIWLHDQVLRELAERRICFTPR